MCQFRYKNLWRILATLAFCSYAAIGLVCYETHLVTWSPLLSHILKCHYHYLLHLVVWPWCLTLSLCFHRFTELHLSAPATACIVPFPFPLLLNWPALSSDKPVCHPVFPLSWPTLPAFPAHHLLKLRLVWYLESMYELQLDATPAAYPQLQAVGGARWGGFCQLPISCSTIWI